MATREEHPGSPLTEDKDRFTAVARIIAKGDPPEWLMLGLEHFRGFVGSERVTSKEYQQFNRTLRDLDNAARLLIKKLPAFNVAWEIYFGAQPEGKTAVTTALEVLPKIRAQLAPFKPPRRGGRRPNAQRRYCAVVVVEAWKLIHDSVEIEPRSAEVLQACSAYWQACGHDERDVENWGRDAKGAATNPEKFIRDILITYKTTI
jgi:hypothetical protein